MAKHKNPVVGQPGYKPQPIDVQEPEVERSIVKPKKTMSLFHHRDLPMDSTTLNFARHQHPRALRSRTVLFWANSKHQLPGRL
jgi:hypothetical protein